MRGTSRPNSDIDVAVEIDPSGLADTALLAYIQNLERWRTEIQRLVPYELDLEIYDPTHLVVKRGVDEHGVLLFKRVT